MYLTRSFRFDNNIARVANMVLSNFKGETQPLVGTPFNNLKPRWDTGRYTVIVRTNATVFDKAVQLLSKAVAVGFVGGVAGYRLNRMKDVYYLFAGRRERINDGYIKGFSDYQSLRAYAAAVEDMKLLSICKVVENYRERLPRLVDEITARAGTTEDARVLLTTAHKSKGLQWKKILLFLHLRQSRKKHRFSAETWDVEKIKVEDAVRTRLAHDITEIRPANSRGRASAKATRCATKTSATASRNFRNFWMGV